MADPRALTLKEPTEILEDYVKNLTGGSEERKVDALAQMSAVAESPLMRVYEAAVRSRRAQFVEALVEGREVRVGGSLIEKHEVRGLLKGLDEAFATFNRLKDHIRSGKEPS